MAKSLLKPLLAPVANPCLVMVLWAARELLWSKLHTSRHNISTSKNFLRF